MAKAKRVPAALPSYDGAGRGGMRGGAWFKGFVRSHAREWSLAVVLLGVALMAGMLVSQVVFDVIGVMLPPQVPTDHRTVSERVPAFIGFFSFGAAAIGVFVLGWSWLDRGEGSDEP